MVCSRTTGTAPIAYAYAPHKNKSFKPNCTIAVFVLERFVDVRSAVYKAYDALFRAVNISIISMFRAIEKRASKQMTSPTSPSSGKLSKCNSELDRCAQNKA